MRRAVVRIGACVCLAALVGVALAQAPEKAGPADAKQRTDRSPATLDAGRPVVVQQGDRITIRKLDSSGVLRIERNNVPAQPAESSGKGLLHRWKAAANDSDRAKVEAQLRVFLKEEFQARLGVHEAEIKQLEAKVKQLREQLELRRKKQDEIVDFRVQQLLREAQGLGWGTESGMGPRDLELNKSRSPFEPAAAPADARGYPFAAPSAPADEADLFAAPAVKKSAPANVPSR